MEAFKDYSKYYDLLYKDKNYKKEAEYIDDLIKRYSPKTKTIFEMGCGTGIHASHLAKLGYKIDGIDISQGMIHEANKKLASLPKSISPKLSFNLGDIRNYKANKQYDSVISLFHIINYQPTNKDLLDTFKTAHLHLSTNGILFFDTWYGPAVIRDLPSVRMKTFEDKSTKIIRFTNPKNFPNQNITEVNFQILIIDKKTNQIKQINEKHVLRYLFLPELNALLEASGFQIIDAHEWLSNKEPGFDTWSVSIVARKSK